MTDEDDKFNKAFDEREAARIGSDLDLAFIRAGGKLTASEAEAARVKAMLKRDRADASKERDRKAAELQVRDGVFVNLADTVIEPTPEWLEKGDVIGFTPKQPDGTVRQVRTVRRVVTPMIERLHRKGAIDETQAAACVWYRKMFERAGLEGRYSISRAGAPNPTSGTRRTGGVGGHIAMTLEEAEARQLWRDVRKHMTAFYIRYFDAVVVDDIPIYRAIRFARCRREKALQRLKQVIDEVVEFCEINDVDMLRISRDWAGVR
ncbi:hypothetical protein [Caenibius sp. WL]|uniref:hypothetical protein n=1 Tax=Caenibius sp. WL TaxID=2872646 RepID=UPI001C99D30C|nr:hypothetical protein [Caenibius sp. WL]QZP06810.1 hypothetical protein K5X80_08720 [Caenibius sp. WL]